MVYGQATGKRRHIARHRNTDLWIRNVVGRILCRDRWTAWRCCSSEKAAEYETFLKWLAFSSNSISFLPAFLATDHSDEGDLRQRAASVGVLSPCYLNHQLSQSVNPARAAAPTGHKPQSASCSLEMLSSGLSAASATPGFGPSEGAFGATLLWEKIVTHLERSVKSGRHSQGLRTFVGCFLGAKAVECCSAYLNTVLPRTTKREQVCVLCQKLLLTGVLEDVKSKSKTEFREDRLYRFTRYHFWESAESSTSSQEVRQHTKTSLLYIATSLS